MLNSQIRPYKLEDSALYKVQTKKKLAKLLFTSIKFLSQIKSTSDFYTSWKEPKKNGGFREINAPNPALKQIQKRIKDLLSNIRCPDHLLCPVKGKSYIHNAASHINSPSINMIDIKDYFPSTSSKRVFWFFRKILKCSEDVAGILTKVTTYNGRLPQGSPASPILSYFAHMDMWEEINNLVKTNSCTLTVYIDDITISGNPIPKGLLWEVKKSLAKRKLAYHKESSSHKGICEITGVILKEGSLLWPNRNHKKLKELKASLIKEKSTPSRISLENKIRSRIAQSKQILFHVT